MIEIKEKPIEKLFIGEHVYYKDAEDLATVLALVLASGQPVALHWASGIVFIVSPTHPDSELLVEKYLDGEMYWTSVAYARMNDYQENIRVKGMEVPVIDASRSNMMKEIASWLKKQIPKS